LNEEGKIIELSIVPMLMISITHKKQRKKDIKGYMSRRSGAVREKAKS